LALLLAVASNFNHLTLSQVSSQMKLICPQSLRLVDVPGKECAPSLPTFPRN
jgi:hypothetical protein